MEPARIRSRPAALAGVALRIALLTMFMMGLGFLLTHVFSHLWPFTGEDQTVRDLVAARAPPLDRLSNLVSLVGFTTFIVPVAVVAGCLMRLVLHRWREGLFLAAALLAQGAMYKLTSVVVARARPPVVQLDDFPPLRSFFSGHTSATVALYGGIAVILARHSRGRIQAVGWWVLLLVLPVGVAISRVYRGMHYPSDVSASFIAGLGCLWILQRAMLAPNLPKGA